MSADSQLGGTAKKKKVDSGMRKTYQFEISLTQSNSENYTEVSWLDLVAREDQENGDLSPSHDDDHDNLNNNKVPKSKKVEGKERIHGFEHLGEGYDEEDSFIDNSECFDEIVPEDITTAHGGFYINCGELEFKELRTGVLGLSSSDEKQVEEKKVKRVKKRVQFPVKEKKKKVTEVKRKSVKVKNKTVESMEMEASALGQTSGQSLPEKPPDIIKLEDQLGALNQEGSPKLVTEDTEVKVKKNPDSVPNMLTELNLHSSVSLTKISENKPQVPNTPAGEKTGWWKNVDFSSDPKESSRAAQVDPRKLFPPVVSPEIQDLKTIISLPSASVSSPVVNSSPSSTVSIEDLSPRTDSTESSESILGL